VTDRHHRSGRRAVAVATGVVLLLGLGAVPLARAEPTVAPAPAEPTIGPLISGTTVQRAGTFAWTDYAYDDRGTDAGAEPTYPAGQANAADLIQLQLRPVPDGLAIRGVLETLTDPAVPSLAVGFDLDGDPATGSPGVPTSGWTVTGASLGLERFVTITSHGAAILAWTGDGWAAAGVGPAAVDAEANTVDARVPWAALGDHEHRIRAVGLVGLAAGGPVYDLAFVRDESPTNFQSNLQAGVLSGAYPADLAIGTVDLDDLQREVVPQPLPGIKNTFLYRSQLRLGEGLGEAIGNQRYRGPYQPYVAWFPDRPLPAHPPLVVFLHGALTTHLDGAYGSSGLFSALPIGPGNIDPDAVVITPLGRGETSLAYDGPAEQDIVDAISDASARFAVDADRVVLTGYSLGGVGTFRMAELYPDRWAGAIEVVGADDLGAIGALQDLSGQPTLPNSLENLRNLPFRMANSRADELQLLIGGIQPDRAAAELQRLGYDVRYWQALLREHLTFPVALVDCEIDAAIARGRVRDPARVTYSQEPALASSDAATGLDVLHDSAYWVSHLVARPGLTRVGDKATVDVTSLARADRAPLAQPFVGVAQNLTEGRDVCGPADVHTNDAWLELGQRLVPGAPQATANAFEAELRGVASVQLDVARMALRATEPLKADVTTDGPARLLLDGRWTTPVVVQVDGAAPVTACATEGPLPVDLAAGHHRVWVTPMAGSCP
jgi:pimeloyl-ACP methyl ester carboxylesterase